MKTIVVSNPCKIYKKISRIVISEHPKNSKYINTYFFPKEVNNIILLNPSSSVSYATLYFKDSPDFCFVKKNEIFASSFHINKSFLNHIIEQKLAKLTKQQKKHLAYIFCKGICRDRIFVLKELNKTRRQPKISSKIRAMVNLERKLSKSKSVQEMKAYEGSIAQYFYSTFKILVPSFKGRDRFGKDLLNTLFNVMHSIIRQKTLKFLIIYGINPIYGFLHFQKDKNKPFLAFDFAEFFIAYFDKLSIYMIQKKIITSKNLKKRTDKNPGFFLNKNGWQKVYKLLNNRFNDKKIEDKVIEFKNYLLTNSNFNWVIH